MRHISLICATVLLSLLSFSCGFHPEDGKHCLHVLATNDVHGSWFDQPYAGGNARRSLFAVKHYVDSVRSAVGEDNVLLIDAGDCLQGDNAAYYFNYVDTVTPHVFPRLVAYMGYDAIVAGNHDVETGHPVYDRVNRDLDRAGIAFLGGNAVRIDDGKPYFRTSRIYHRAGLKVAVLGYTNANIKAWLDESLWSGLDFKSLLPLVQEDVDALVSREKPQVVIVAVHSGTGDGDGGQLESQGKDLLQSLHGVDFVVASHDHRPTTIDGRGISLINSGSHARYLAEGVMTVETAKGQVSSKSLESRLIPVDAAKADSSMREAFRSDFEAVKAFTLRKVGELKTELRTRDAYVGMCDYMNLIHTVSLRCAPARISFAAPLTYNGTVKAGTLVFNDMFTIYPYENQLFVVNMTGKEIKDYLEFSYDGWIRTMSKPDDHVLKIAHQPDPRTGQNRWSFVGRSYNFDSAAGINYTVDVTAACGERVRITSLADGSAFSPDETYPVAMTSYRASGGGGLVIKGAGISQEEMQGRIVQKYPEIRNLIYEYILERKELDPVSLSAPETIGSWSFVPEKMASMALEADFGLLFR